MKYLAIKNWERYQHYQTDDRRPAWVKLYVNLLNPSKHPTYTELSDGAKLSLHHLWLLAAETGNRIPDSWLNRDRLNMQTRPKVDELLASGLVLWSSDAASSKSIPHVSVRSASASVSSETNERFEEIWARYPKRIGKRAALRHFGASVQTDEDFAAISRALDRYIEHCSTLSGPAFVQYGSTWFNNWRDWLDDSALSPAIPIRAAATPDGLAPEPEDGVTVLRRWSDMRGAVAVGPHPVISPAAFAAWRTWMREMWDGELVNEDGSLNDYAAYIAATKGAVA